MANGKLPDAGPGNDGAPTVAPGTLRWVRSLSSVEALGVADGPGGLVVTGAITAPANLGGQQLTPTGMADLVVAGLNADDGSHLYSVRYGDTGQAFGFLHNVDANGSPLIYGVSYGSVDLGGGRVMGGSPGVAMPPADGYIGKYGPGAPGWIARIVGSGEDKILATAPADGSRIYGAGWFENTPAFNGATLSSAGNRDLFLARFNTFVGTVDLTRTYGGAGRDEISAAAAAGNDLVLTGMFGDVAGAPQDVLDFKGTANRLISNGGLDVWVARLDDTGAGIWAVHYGGSGDDRDPKIAVDTAGDIYVAGSFTNQVMFGANKLVANGGADIFVAKLRGNDGSVAWAVSLGSTGTDGVGDLAVDAVGHVVLVASLGGPIDNGTSAGGVDAIIATFDAANGTAGWRKVFSTKGDDRASAVMFGRNGDIYAVMNMGDMYEFGMPVIGTASYAAVLLRIAP